MAQRHGTAEPAFQTAGSQRQLQRIRGQLQRVDDQLDELSASLHPSLLPSSLLIARRRLERELRDRIATLEPADAAAAARFLRARVWRQLDRVDAEVARYASAP